MAEYQYSRHSRDLDTARATESPELLAAGVCELTVEELEDEAYLHFGARDADPVRAFEGMAVSVASTLESELGDVYLSNPAGSGSIRVTVRNGLCVSYGSGSKGGSDAFVPYETGLSGSFSGGDVSSEDLNVVGVDHLDVRGRVTGIAAFAQASKSTIYPDVGVYTGIATARDGSDRAFVLDPTDGELHEVDLADETAPTLAATIALTGFTDGADHILFDPDENIVLALGDDGGVNPTLKLAVVDVSTPGTPVEDASFTVDSSSGSYSMARIPGEAQVIVFRGDAELIDYSTSTSPSTLDTVAASVGTVGMYVESQETAYGINNSEEVTILDVDPSIGSMVIVGGPTDITSGTSIADVPQNEMAFVDQGLNLGFIPADDSNGDGGFAMFRLEPSGLTFIDEEYSISNNYPADGELDEGSQRLVAVSASTGGIPVHLWTYTETAIDKLDTFTPDRQERTVGFGINFDLIHIPQQTEHEVWEFDEGQDVLRVAPLDPRGDPISGLVQEVTLPDGSEGLISLDLDGIGTVEVSHRAATGRAGTIDYVDAYREAL